MVIDEIEMRRAAVAVEQGLVGLVGECLKLIDQDHVGSYDGWVG